MTTRSRRFRGGAAAARRARRAVREELSGALAEPRLGDVELLVSELATNSFRHAGCDESLDLAMATDVTPDRVRVQVIDRGTGFELRPPQPPAEGAASGYGLMLLERLADRWGVHRGDGFCVWFEVERTTRA
jgi:anti-sigma regulatory factor (Ser/Thr protein kinase)